MGSDWGTAGGLKLCVALERDCALKSCAVYVNHNKVVKDCSRLRRYKDQSLMKALNECFAF